MGAENYTMDIIAKSWESFDRFNIVEGAFTDPSVYFGEDEYTKKQVAGLDVYIGYEDKLWVIDSPWNDSLAHQYSILYNMSEEGDWILCLDSDEYASQLLMDNLDNIIKKSINGTMYDIVLLPVVDFLDGQPLWTDFEVPQIYEQGQWVKHIFVRKGKNAIQLDCAESDGKTNHAIAKGTKYTYYPYPYYHKKNAEDFVRNEIWQMYLTPEGQRLDPIECARFKNAMKMSHISSSHHFTDKIDQGDLNPVMEKMICEYKERFVGTGKDLHPMTQTYISYFHMSDNGKIDPDAIHDKEWYLNYVRQWKRNNLTYK